MPVAAPAMPVKPNTPAISATTNKITIVLIKIYYLVL